MSSVPFMCLICVSHWLPTLIRLLSIVTCLIVSTNHKLSLSLTAVWIGRSFTVFHCFPGVTRTFPISSTCTLILSLPLSPFKPDVYVFRCLVVVPNFSCLSPAAFWIPSKSKVCLYPRSFSLVLSQSSPFVFLLVFSYRPLPGLDPALDFASVPSPFGYPCTNPCLDPECSSFLDTPACWLKDPCLDFDSDYCLCLGYNWFAGILFWTAWWSLCLEYEAFISSTSVGLCLVPFCQPYKTTVHKTWKK